MINIKKEINLNSSLINKNNEIELNLSTLYINKPKFNNFTFPKPSNEIKVANNDVILANIVIKNTGNIPLDDLKFKICNTDIFKFIPSSLKNKTTKELYIYESIKDNIFSLGSLDTNNNLNIEFCMRAYLNNLNLSANSSIKLLSFKNDNLENEKLNLVKIDRNELQISSNPNKNLIELINIGSKPLKNIVYRYEIPNTCSIDMSSISYHSTDTNCNIIHQQIKNNILFKIDNLSQNKKLQISLIHKRTTPCLLDPYTSIK